MTSCMTSWVLEPGAVLTSLARVRKPEVFCAASTLAMSWSAVRSPAAARTQRGGAEAKRQEREEDAQAPHSYLRASLGCSREPRYAG